MATNYPGGLDSLSNPSAGSAQTSPSHAGQHTNANDAIEAIQGELGTDPSGSAATVRARLEGIEAGTRLAAGGVSAAQLAPDVLGRLGNALTDAETLLRLAAIGIVGASGTEETSSTLRLTSLGSSINARANRNLLVSPGAAYTSTVRFASGTASQVRVVIDWYTSGGTLISQAAGSFVTAGGTAVATAAAPGSASYAYAWIDVAATTGQYAVLTEYGFWKGAGGRWSMPNEPLQYAGIRPNPANTAQVQVWNDATATWITV